MKKFRYIYCALTLLVASATAHAQVYDVTLTKEGATAATYTAKNATLVTFSYNGDVPTVEFTSGQSAGSSATDLEHTARYNITFGKATSAINNGTGEPAADNNGTVWAGAKPRKTASQEPQETEISGPTLVIITTGGYGAYTLSSENTTITLKYDGTYYTVNSSDSDNKLSDVEAIYYVDPHRGVKTEAVAPTSTADGNIDYWTCSRCSKYFGDAACTEEVAKNSWVRAMVSGNITWEDSDDVDSKRPESVTITLLRGGELTDKSATVIASDNWAFSFTDLPRYDGESKITYSVSENAITDYTTAVDGYNVTNTHTHTHSFVPVMDGENPSFTWTEYSAAKLNLKCSNTKCTGTSSVDATSITSEVTTVPTTEAEGVQTYTTKATYKEVEYVGTKTATIEKLPAADKAISGDITPANNSVTVINASNIVEEGRNAPTITVTPGTAENPNTANIIITGENTEAKVNVIVHSNATLNIYGDGKAKVSGKIEVVSGGKMDLSGATFDGTINASGTMNVSRSKIYCTVNVPSGSLNLSESNVDGTINASAGATVTLSKTNVTSTTGAAIILDGGSLYLGKSTITGAKGQGAINSTSDAYDLIHIGNNLAVHHYGSTGTGGGFIFFDTSSLAPARSTTAQTTTYYKSEYDSYTICDATHTDANFTGQKTFMGLNSTELTGFYVCDDGCGNTSATPTYTRTMANKWGTLVLPFDVTIDNTKPYDFYTVSGVTSTELTLTKVETGSIAAGTPVLVRINAEEVNAATSKTYTLTLTAPAKSVSTTITNPAAVGGLTLTGTYAVAEVTNGYIIGNDAFHDAATLKSKDALWKDSQGNAITAGDRHVYCQPFRAYLAGTLSNPNGAPARLTIGTGNGDDTTALEAIEAITEGDATGTEPVEYFDMNGHRIDNLQQGVNIVKRGSKTYKVIIK